MKKARQIVEEVLAASKRVGLAVGLSVPKQGIHEIWCQGRVSALRGGPMLSVERLFDAASWTKGLAALRLLQFIYLGVIGLDENISRFLRHTKAGNQYPITPRHLLSYGLNFSFKRNPKHCTDGQSLSELFCAGELIEPPGTQHRYSNVTGWFIQQLIEAISEKPFDQTMKEDLFSPLGLQSTVFSASLSGRPVVPVSVMNDAGGLEHIFGRPADENAAAFHPMACGIAGVFMSVGDALRSLHVLMNFGRDADGKQFLSQELVQQVFTNQWEGKSTARHGMGLGMQPANWREGEFTRKAQVAMQHLAFFRGGTGFTVWVSQSPRFSLVFAPAPFETTMLRERGEAEMKQRYHRAQGDVVRDILNQLCG